MKTENLILFIMFTQKSIPPSLVGLHFHRNMFRINAPPPPRASLANIHVHSCRAT